MLQTPFLKSVFKRPPPPLWYVTNGELTVGPVDTALLVRGVEHGRVPEYCHVRAFSGGWRELHGVREIAAMCGAITSEPSVEQLAEWGRFLRRVRDEDELCHTSAWLSLVATGAESAMFHYAGGQGPALFTRAVLGPISNARLGYPLSEFDLVLRSARRGVPIQGPPHGAVQAGLAKRLGQHTGEGGVAMIPFFVAGKLRAMIELARPSHAFRCTDLQRLENIIQRALQARLGTSAYC